MCMSADEEDCVAFRLIAETLRVHAHLPRKAQLQITRNQLLIEQIAKPDRDVGWRTAVARGLVNEGEIDGGNASTPGAACWPAGG